MGFKGSVYVCLCVSGPVFTVKTCLPPRRSKALPAPLVTYIGMRFRSLLPLAVELAGYIYTKIVPHWRNPFCTGRAWGGV